MLLPLGYNIIAVNNGKQAIDKIKTIEPDIALINVLMPEVDGIEVCRLIKADKQTSSVPVIIITALDDTESKISALSAGADEFLTKPIDRSELILRVKNLLKVKQHVDSLNKIISEKTRSLQSTIETLKQGQIKTIYKLSKVVEYMDQNIGNHNERVSRYVMIITNALGISRDEAETISVASCMHDIGKIGVPQSILLKPDSLTTNEFKQVKEHTTIGANILSSAGSKILDLAAEIALTHHERWEGNGYPMGLAGNLIPITGRITAIADVFDALTMKKTYRPAFSVENAIEAINAESGKHFDPELVDVFLKRIKDIIEVTYLLKD
ncbi:MAG: response regulator [Deltaproteobacteria bacterium]|nr:response regulator [Deltaproteobacteria bacterium]